MSSAAIRIHLDRMGMTPPPARIPPIEITACYVIAVHRHARWLSIRHPCTGQSPVAAVPTVDMTSSRASQHLLRAPVITFQS